MCIPQREKIHYMMIHDDIGNSYDNNNNDYYLHNNIHGKNYWILIG